jgi:hypothetical protein
MHTNEQSSEDGNKHDSVDGVVISEDEEEEDGVDEVEAGGNIDDEVEEEEEEEKDDIPEPPPEIPRNASILQCLQGLINIFDAAIKVDFQIIDRETLLHLFETKREQILLHDVNVLEVLQSIFDLCNRDAAALDKMNRWTVHGTKRRLRKDGEEMNNNDEIIELD